MGIEGNFRQISPPLLEIVRQDLYMLNLYLHAKESIETAEIQYLPTYLRDENLHGDLDAILADDQWRIGRLDIDSDWHAMHYLLTEDASSWEECKLPFVVTKHKSKNWLLINAVMGGTAIEETTGGFMDFAPVRYLAQPETQIISEAFLQISEKEFKYRYEEACECNPKVFRGIRDGEFEDYWYRFRCISEYYKVAVQMNRGMLLYLGCFYGVDFEWEDIPIE
ncbi:hypothetical protein NIES2135_06880 [Leptolyngbya boryana NIES-2135]|jgi:hypothetical protein|uniref:Uncharacterized protein n=1 Tax=Leptolyngbya boryana NIES-2135 TaxID=1973484 RepID=A0A1Z4JAU6_LEPBY|nr:MULTISPECIES: DUF1877 family protein [Leptolyngbya]BAY53876.1 hypothetical protein NIES2135_06880 [Leptolyngbya boryana NIES-2135]MBD2370903.1 DUF1877 family protein [Leptolyngbya sp. FACHB-161]MBD2377417.1 DUF1877 family protein [Leptolyngbya sp. FACHB-238]MBD2401825.1 DUF1877 family protein [Leptolyngbya sp. FACHB-239]MBD2408344.1 DUF1877 family protein [Leptolyngbya sp. FACHB-402]